MTNINATFCPCCGCTNATVNEPGPNCTTCPPDGTPVVTVTPKTCDMCTKSGKKAQASIDWTTIIAFIMQILALFGKKATP